MTLFNHGVQSAIIAYKLWPSLWFAAAAFLLGVLPDIGRFIFDSQKQKDTEPWGGFYTYAHTLDTPQLLIPFWNLHILEDYYTHDHINGGWLWWAIYLEIFLWLVMISILFL